MVYGLLRAGVATYCKDTATPSAAEEGLTGLLSHEGAVGCYGDQAEFSSEELQLLDNEGRAVITRHKVKSVNNALSFLNMLCPHCLCSRD